jgi:phosphoglycolate phosphatase
MRLRAIRRLCGGRLPRLVIFDLDGTLIDSVPDIARALDAALHAFDLPAAGAGRIRQWVGRGSRRLVSDALAFAGAASAPGRNMARVDALLQRYLTGYLADCTTLTTLSPGVSELLAALDAAGIRYACATNKPERIALKILAHFGLAERMAAVVGGDSGWGTKPDAAPLLALLQSLDLDANAALMVGDSRHDVDAARAARIPVVCIAGGYNHGEDIRLAAPDLVVGHFCELL